MLSFMFLSIFLGILAIYFALGNVKQVTKIDNSNKVVARDKTKEESKSVSSKDNKNEENPTEFIENFITTLFNYDEKTAKTRISNLENMVSPIVYDKLQKGLFYENETDKVICELESTSYFWSEKVDNNQSVIVEIRILYTINEEKMTLKQLIKIDLESQDKDMIIYDYLLLNNSTW